MIPLILYVASASRRWVCVATKTKTATDPELLLIDSKYRFTGTCLG